MLSRLNPLYTCIAVGVAVTIGMVLQGRLRQGRITKKQTITSLKNSKSKQCKSIYPKRMDAACFWLSYIPF